MMNVSERLHQEMTDELREFASLYALGALTQEENAAYEAHLSAGCALCRAEVASFREVTGAIALSAEPVTPRAELRDRLISTTLRKSQITDENAPGTLYEKDGVLISRPQEMNWTAGQLPGLFMKVLFSDSQRGYTTALVRMTAGTHYPRHKHAGVEELYLLEGDLSVDELSMLPGDYCRGEVGSIHGEILTNTGCLFIVSSSHHDEIFA
jgi:anti-sigma factor ChrR (cupin superfamily)